MKWGPLSTPPGQQYWAFTCSFGAAPDSKSMVIGAAAAEAERIRKSAATRIPEAVLVAERAMNRRYAAVGGTSVPRESRFGPPGRLA